jgi:osmotically inducible lipoprotein OsmB
MPMNRSTFARATTAIAAAAMLISTAGPAEAKRACKRLNKTEGAVLGGVGGAVLGKVLLGGTGGTLVGAAAGGVAGHEIARKKYNRHCYRYRRTR